MGNAKVMHKGTLSDLRLFFLILRAALGIALFAKLDFKTTWVARYSYAVSNGGLPPIDTTLQQLPDWVQEASLVVLSAWTFILDNPALAIPVPPYQCTSNDCMSFFYPGSTGLVVNGSVWEKGAYPEANAIVLNNAPGYQLEFTSLTNVPPDATAVCHRYATSSIGIQLCIQTDGSDIIAGPFPLELIS